MTASDISTTTKEFEDTSRSLKNLYLEFWMEGDRRKQMNFPIVPMMDRQQEKEIPNQQVNFYSMVVIKCYETLSKIFPSCHPMEVAAKLNLEKWVEEAENVANLKNKKVGDICKDEANLKEEKPVLLTDNSGVWMVEKSRKAEMQESKLFLENM